MIRGYQPVYSTFQYDFARDGGAVGYISLGDIIPVGFGMIWASCHVITSFAGAAADIDIAYSVDGIVTGGPTPAINLDIGEQYWLQTGRGPYASVSQTIGIEISGGVVTAGKGVFCVGAFIITEP